MGIQLMQNYKVMFEPPFVDLGVAYALHLQLIKKLMLDFLLVII